MSKYLIYVALVLVGAMFASKIRALPVVGSALAKVGG